MAIVLILLIFWLLGLITNVIGAAIHVLLAVALVVIAYRFLSGRRAA